jgi:hypothetical protein
MIRDKSRFYPNNWIYTHEEERSDYDDEIGCQREPSRDDEGRMSDEEEEAESQNESGFILVPAYETIKC